MLLKTKLLHQFEMKSRNCLCTAPHYTSVSPDLRRLLDHSGSGKVQFTFFSQQTEPFGVSPRGLSRPKFGQHNEDGASVPAEASDVNMTPVRYFWSLQVFSERPVNIIRYRQGNSPQSHNLSKQCDGTF